MLVKMYEAWLKLCIKLEGLTSKAYPKTVPYKFTKNTNKIVQ